MLFLSFRSFKYNFGRFLLASGHVHTTPASNVAKNLTSAASASSGYTLCISPNMSSIIFSPADARIARWLFVKTDDMTLLQASDCRFARRVTPFFSHNKLFLNHHNFTSCSSRIDVQCSVDILCRALNCRAMRSTFTAVTNVALLQMSVSVTQLGECDRNILLKCCKFHYKMYTADI